MNEEIYIEVLDNPAEVVVFEPSEGLPGPAGNPGPAGPGVPTGGTTGQTLVKLSSFNYDTAWATPAGGGDMVKSIYDTDNDGVVDAAETVPWSGVSGKPSTFAPSSHSHAIGDVTGLQTALDNKAPAGHTHIISDTSGLQTALDGKAATSHSHLINDVTGLQTALDAKVSTSELGTGVATLVAGKVPSNQLPSYVDDVIEAANFAALPGTGEQGKIYITIDNNKVYRWSGTVYVEISSPALLWGSITGTLSNQTDLQNALNGKAASSHSHIISDVTGLQTALDGKAATSHTHTIANVTGLQTALDAKEPSVASGTSAQYYRGDKTFQTLDKNAVGLSSVDNTSDANKPISSATQTALNGKANTSHSHIIADVTGLQTALDGKAASSHTHSQSDITNLTTDLAAKQKTITSGTAAPTGGVDGDIYLQYT